MLLDSEIMTRSKLYVVGKVVMWLIGLKSNGGGWMRAQSHLYKKSVLSSPLPDGWTDHPQETTGRLL